MGKFDTYKVDLKGMQQDQQVIEYLLDSNFFANIGGEDVQNGKIKVQLTVNKVGGAYQMDFSLNGSIMIPCDRCLDDMDFPIETTSRLTVKFGKDYAEESDEIIVVPESEGVINLAWFLYEFVALAIPIKHVHAPGKCNKQMAAKLRKHSATVDGDDSDAFEPDYEEDIDIADEEEDKTDPRWDALKSLK
ncbi:MAG: DUF177 domain-containing protein [Candidatus Symbiothrix sp.]|nr:DUF177 domain-containing protein [Candidatus Symbiothrix sp.]